MRPALVALLGLIGLLAAPAWAASGRYLTPDDVAARAAQVVEGLLKDRP